MERGWGGWLVYFFWGIRMVNTTLRNIYIYNILMGGISLRLYKDPYELKKRRLIS